MHILFKISLLFEKFIFIFWKKIVQGDHYNMDRFNEYGLKSWLIWIFALFLHWKLIAYSQKVLPDHFQGFLGQARMTSASKSLKISVFAKTLFW